MEIKRFPLGALWTNAYLVWDKEGKAFLTDPGGDAQEVLDFIKERGLSLELVLLTHGHADHIGGLREVAEKAKRGVAIHELDADMLVSPSLNLSKFMGEAFSVPAPTQRFKDGDLFRVGVMEIHVIHTPGHTPGSSCFLVSDGEERILLSGDTLFARSVGRTDLPGGDEEALAKSLQRLDNFPDGLRVYPGHGPETTIGEERRNNPFWPRAVPR